MLLYWKGGKWLSGYMERGMSSKIVERINRAKVEKYDGKGGY